MNKTKLPILLIGIGIISVIWSFRVDAQLTALSITPLTFELTANPGDSLSHKLKVYNPNDNNVFVKMEVEDFKTVGEEGQIIVVPDEETTYSLKKWVKTEPTEFALEPKEHRFVSFTIEVPKNAEPGGKYGSILASATSDTEEMPYFSVKQGSLILLTVSGDMIESLIIKEFSAPENSEKGPILFTIRFENNGTVQVIPRGYIAISDCQGEKIDDISFQQINILPDAVRKVEALWDRERLTGCYTATLVGSYGTTETPFTSEEITFRISPNDNQIFPPATLFPLGGFGIILEILTVFLRVIKLWPF